MHGKSVLMLAALLMVLAISFPRAVAQPLSLITITNNWKYDQSGADLSGQFNQVGFNDTTWLGGKGLLGLETGAPYPYP